MKYPVKSYEKLFNSVLLRRFPEIESIEVKQSPFYSFDDLNVKVHVKDYDYKKYGVEPCSKLGRELQTNMIKLSEYFGMRLLPYIKIYFQGKKICDSSDWAKGPS